MLKVSKGYTFDDLLLVPKHSEVTTRKNVDLSVDLGKDTRLDIPIVSANMKNVTGSGMALTLERMGGLPILHRFCTIQENVDMFHRTTYGNIGCSVGVNEAEKDRASALHSAGCRVFCVDVAHGDHTNCVEMVRWLATKFGDDTLIIAGNVATGSGAVRLALAGADVIKVGVGPGSLCTTRIETGNGVPQMTALNDVRESLGGHDVKIIADGGIRRAGDIVKALCFADAVMLGSMLAGTDEAPGDVIQVDGRPVKAYEGSSTHKTSHIEGIKAHVPLKGPVKPIITNLLDGIRSGCSYQGVENLVDLKKDPQFVEISNAGLAESHPHSVISKG